VLRKPKVSLRQQCRGGVPVEHSFAGPVFFSLIASFLFIASNPKVNIARAIAWRREVDAW
jgi:hypothetical protein